MKISFEIVPRTTQAFDDQYQFALSLGKSISMINVPDIQRFDIRSWDTVDKIDRNVHQFVPHFRATDFSLESGDIFKIIEENELDHVLLVSGDPPEGMRKVHDTSVLDLIASVGKRFPEVTIHAGFDPHRSGLQDECDYVFRKVDAGASSFFSQPFYDPRLIEIYAEHLQEVDTFIGLSPITTTSSKNYWKVKNKVKFPNAFKAEYAWNIDFSNQVIAMAQEMNFNIYFMPIRIDLERFFGALDL
ncbi:MAG: methylenetetrahydrofolate reductase [Methylococcales symbiont of Iophon sp. n. MRB-2018]|nr:MAG: methylenetetrahydrofolate reductase [Methylococcales symbiont of Iophon sp. n. MRB-2018]KAF3979029.1 MAG: methylenetetrahydrofolate reductase [Methylococcales symbiont of Iophon sp. n. MRB-2018]